ncbi:MAG TPA: hypothetical protein DIW47_15210 [Bacteroidetes bacterium]|nr:hypothetical protein [Bacteroidota bacterium]
MACRTFRLRNLFLWLLCAAGTLAQAQDYDSIMRFSLANLKSRFAEMPAKEQAQRLELETLRYPKRQEAYYLLAYTYSRMNSEEAQKMPEMTYPMTLKVSQLLEKVISIDSTYNGPLVVLDVYSKINSEWSSLALKYLAEEKPDSARICFNESLKRGGINPAILQIHRHILDAIEPGAFLISSGDNCTYSLLYLQFMENYRTDIRIADVSLIGTSWYYTYLVNHGFPHYHVFDSLVVESYYTPWQDTTLHFDGMDVLAEATYGGAYIGQSGRIILDLLSHYGPKKLFYLVHGSDPEQNFGMSDRGCIHYSFVRFEGENAHCEQPAIGELDWQILENLDRAQTHDRSIQRMFDLYVHWFLYYLYSRMPDEAHIVKQEYARFKTVYPQKRHPEFYEDYSTLIAYFDEQFKE